MVTVLLDRLLARLAMILVRACERLLGVTAYWVAGQLAVCWCVRVVAEVVNYWVPILHRRPALVELCLVMPIALLAGVLTVAVLARADRAFRDRGAVADPGRIPLVLRWPLLRVTAVILAVLLLPAALVDLPRWPGEVVPNLLLSQAVLSYVALVPPRPPREARAPRLVPSEAA